MEQGSPKTKEVFCPLCDEMVMADYAGREKKMDRYECPNELTPGERHGIFVNPAEEAKKGREDESASTDKQSPVMEENYIANLPHSDGRGFQQWVKSGLEHYGFAKLLEKLFPPKTPDPNTSANTNHTHPLAEHTDQPLPHFDIPKAEDFTKDLDDLKLDFDNLPDPDTMIDPPDDWLDAIT